MRENSLRDRVILNTSCSKRQISASAVRFRDAHTHATSQHQRKQTTDWRLLASVLLGSCRSSELRRTLRTLPNSLRSVPSKGKRGAGKGVGSLPHSHMPTASVHTHRRHTHRLISAGHVMFTSFILALLDSSKPTPAPPTVRIMCAALVFVLKTANPAVSAGGWSGVPRLWRIQCERM